MGPSSRLCHDVCLGISLDIYRHLYYVFIMRRASFFLPDDLRNRLAVESHRSGVPVAELVRRYLDAMTPPVTMGMGELRKYVDRQGLLKVLVLSARDGKLLVEPDDNKWQIQIWVDSNLVSFAEESQHH